jgi:hypothetical protein
MKNYPFRRELFWDVDPATIDVDQNARYVIERILDLGNQNDVRWLLGQYPEKQIKVVISTSRRLHKKSAHFWGLMYHIPLTNIRCLHPVSRRTQRAHTKNSLKKG